MSQTAFNPSRRQLLTGDSQSKRLPIRPPWGRPENEFIENCNRCGDCIAQCPEHILIPGSGGYPEVDFQHGECTFCQACLRSCPEPAFLTTDQSPWPIKAMIDSRCVSHQQVVCRSCVEQCEPQAITLKMQPGGVGVPQLNSEQCSGCGACVAVCPTQAISMQRPANIKLPVANTSPIKMIIS